MPNTDRQQVDADLALRHCDGDHSNQENRTTIVNLNPASLPEFPDHLALLTSSAVPLRGLTTLKVGGPARMVCRLTTPEVAQQFHSIARKTGFPFYAMGAGSNILAPDAGYPGLIFKVETRDFCVKDNTITCGAGLGFDQMITRSLDAGLVGLEFASGIPGTVGGAVIGNAGCYGHEICEFLHAAQVLTPDGELVTLGPGDFDFGYRSTCLRESGSILLNATFSLVAGNAETAQRSRQERLADRRAKHPVDLPCAGSWFRNLPPTSPGERRQSAGRLLEMVGAKTMFEGDARIFSKHANIIINAGHATSRDISRLVIRMRDAVRLEFGVELVEEVRRLPTDM